MYSTLDAPRLDFVLLSATTPQAKPVRRGPPADDSSLGRRRPAPVKSSDIEKWLAFREAFKELEAHIRIFASLPIHALDRIKLQERLDAIGQSYLAPSGPRVEPLREHRRAVDILQRRSEMPCCAGRCRPGRRTGSRRWAACSRPAAPSGRPLAGRRCCRAAFGPKLPAFSGPATNSQNGVEVLELRLARIVVVRGAVVHVGGEPHDVADVLALDEAQQLGDLQLAARAPGRRPFAGPSHAGGPARPCRRRSASRAACRRR